MHTWQNSWPHVSFATWWASSNGSWQSGQISDIFFLRNVLEIFQLFFENLQKWKILKNSQKCFVFWEDSQGNFYVLGKVLEILLQDEYTCTIHNDTDRPARRRARLCVLSTRPGWYALCITVMYDPSKYSENEVEQKNHLPGNCGIDS